MLTHEGLSVAQAKAPDTTHTLVFTHAQAGAFGIVVDPFRDIQDLEVAGNVLAALGSDIAVALRQFVRRLVVDERPAARGA